MSDPLNCFVPGPRLHLDGRKDGSLSGLAFAAKDLFDVAGAPTGCGHPLWPQTHSPPTRTASAVQRLLDAGAALVGKTHTDELAFSLNGENVHYGTPVNPACPDRIPGGSSSGSASATAGKACDIGLGSDTGGSVRVPASYCGLYGIRTSHGAVPGDGLAALAPSFDTVGWFARDAATLERAGHVLLPESDMVRPERVIVAADAFACLEDAPRASLDLGLAEVRRAIADGGSATLAAEGLGAWFQAFRTLQFSEVWATHGAWIEAHRPRFGPGIRERFLACADVTGAAVAQAGRVRAAATARMEALLPPGTLLCLPTAPGIAPRKGTPAESLEAFRIRLMQLTCIAGLARLPQVSLPLGVLDGCPIGLSLVAGRGQDRSLLAAARAVADAVAR